MCEPTEDVHRRTLWYNFYKTVQESNCYWVHSKSNMKLLKRLFPGWNWGKDIKITIIHLMLAQIFKLNSFDFWRASNQMIFLWNNCLIYVKGCFFVKKKLYENWQYHQKKSNICQPNIWWFAQFKLSVYKNVASLVLQLCEGAHIKKQDLKWFRHNAK